jgi:CheY-like chemotaxis protein
MTRASTLPAMTATLPRVLLVEDNADARQLLRLLLELEGFTVEEAADGPEGLRKALAWRPDAVVLDIGLPGLDGYAVARRLRAAFGPRLRLIALTAYGQPGDRDRGYAAGFDHYLTKPADFEELDFLLRTGPGAPDGDIPSRPS